MTGCFYDEVVLSALELTGADEKGGRFIPRSSKYLLYAYHLLQEKKIVRPKSTHNPLGDITTHKRWSIAEETLFEKLCIEGNLKEEVYLVAYLACWLCTFVLPSKDVNSIRPSTFKMVSMMMNGRRVSLAIPILASIYEGLNTIATSSRPARTSPSFPVHFVYAWLTPYFKTHYPVWQGLCGPKMTRFFGEGGAKYYDPQEARKWIYKTEFVSWACNMIVKNRPFRFIDNSDAEELDHDYFIAIYSSYLNLRQGDKFIIGPYSPHRFGRQFGYFQDVPGTLKYDTRATSLEEGLRYWRLCVLSKSSSKAWLPSLPINTKKFCSEAYKAWWAKVHGTFLDDNIACLINPKPTKITIKRKKPEDEQINGGENNLSHVLVPSTVVKSNSQAVAVEASKGKGPLHNLVDSDTSNKDRHWKRQKKELTPLKAAKASTSRSPSADFVTQKMKSCPLMLVKNLRLVIHGLRLLLQFGMGLKGKQLPQPPAVSVLEARSLSSQKLSRSLHGQHLKEAKARLQDVQAKASEGASKVQSIVDELEHVENEIVALKGRRTSLCAALKEQKQLNHYAQAKVHEVEEDIATLDNTAPLDDAIVEDPKVNLEIFKEDLKSLKPFA
ncbi:UNVERIFIED_CONTAM: hypothetical protein Slati_3950600 [Sesamum latifolium]|uniref:Aminotransferase-like plant mobile domain-containing protein n=1 Tax=Sesamum latifolium TaxID=2727402 RepID=A0AAW2TNQ5_9LAMI